MFRRISQYSFVLTIMWFGIALFISFVETPLRFVPERVSVDESVSIGRLVFHALNATELIFVALMGLAIFVGDSGGRTIRNVWMAVALVLAIQTLLLFLVMDPRVELVLAGKDVPKSPVHLVYILLEIMKLALLALLAIKQLKWFQLQDR